MFLPVLDLGKFAVPHRELLDRSIIIIEQIIINRAFSIKSLILYIITCIKTQLSLHKFLALQTFAYGFLFYGTDII